MTLHLPKSSALLLLVGLPFAAAHAQATAAATGPAFWNGFNIPTLAGSLRYAVSASESVTTGYNGNSQNVSSTVISGDVAYLSSSDIRPFSLIFSGGYLFDSGGQPSSSFENLALSQVLITRSNQFTFSDSISYLPETATAGLSGIPGIGDLGAAPIQVGNAGQGVLTDYQSRVNNAASVSVAHRLTGKLSLNGSGAYVIQRFLGGGLSAGIDSDQVSLGFGPSYRIDARSNVGASYSYSRFTYPGTDFSFYAQSINLSYSRQFSRKLSASVSAGPQFTSSSNSALIPSSSNVAASVQVNYATQYSGASASYSRGVNSGSGVVQGANQDSLYFNLVHTFNRRWNAAATAGYTTTSSLATLVAVPFSSKTYVASFQVGRALTRTLSAYASYTDRDQSETGFASTPIVFSGFSQVFGAGITFSPPALRLGSR